jgi:hypothetical protein
MLSPKTLYPVFIEQVKANNPENIASDSGQLT